MATKRIYVTRAQKSAAETILKRDAAKGRPSRSSVTKIANARSSATGQYVVNDSPADQQK